MPFNGRELIDLLFAPYQQQWKRWQVFFQKLIFTSAKYLVEYTEYFTQHVKYLPRGLCPLGWYFTSFVKYSLCNRTKKKQKKTSIYRASGKYHSFIRTQNIELHGHHMKPTKERSTFSNVWVQLFTFGSLTRLSVTQAKFYFLCNENKERNLHQKKSQVSVHELPQIKPRKRIQKTNQEKQPKSATEFGQVMRELTAVGREGEEGNKHQSCCSAFSLFASIFNQRIANEKVTCFFLTYQAIKRAEHCCKTKKTQSNPDVLKDDGPLLPSRRTNQRIKSMATNYPPKVTFCELKSQQQQHLLMQRQ